MERRLRSPCFGRTAHLLWGGSAALIVAAFAAFGGGSALSLAASLVGVTSLIFNAKSHPVGQALRMLFSVLYGILSYSCACCGEMIAYLGMTAPMAAAQDASYTAVPVCFVLFLANDLYGFRCWLRMRTAQGA